VHEVSVDVETKEGGLMRHSAVPFVFVNTQGSMSPCVTAREAKEKVGQYNRCCDCGSYLMVHIGIASVVNKTGYKAEMPWAVRVVALGLRASWGACMNFWWHIIDGCWG